jgi:hypothetical protein
MLRLIKQSFKRMAHMITELLDAAKHFDSPSVPGLLRGAPDLQPLVGYIESLYYSPDSGEFPLTSYKARY